MKITGRQLFRNNAKKANIPFEVTMELTYRCNLSCVHCYLREGTGDELGTAEIIKIIDQLNDCGTLHLVFTGGEPLLRDDFFDIAFHARQRGLALTLLTNGTLIDSAAARRIKSLDFYEVSISLYGFDCHDRVTGVKGSLDNTLNAIKYLTREGTAVDIKTPVMNCNYNEIPQIEKFCEQNGLSYSPNPSITICSDGTKDTLGFRMSDKELGRYMLKRVRGGEKIGGFRVFCNTGRSMAAVSPSGDVFPCIALKKVAGNLREKSFLEIWDQSPYLKWLRGLDLSCMEECCACNLKEFCQLCPAEALEEEGDLLRPHIEACRIAKKRHKIIQHERRNADG